MKEKHHEKKVPRHVAIIMDGNRRDAEARGEPPIEGHKKGTKRIEPIIRAAAEAGVEVLTLWAMSRKNFEREEGEVDGLMTVFRKAIGGKMGRRMVENGVRIRAIGDLGRFPKDIQQGIQRLEEASANNEGIIVNFALNYDGRGDITRAVNQIVDEGVGPITEEMISDHLDTAGQPDPDLLIRTGGENRTSGFLIWQADQAEIRIEKELWPNYKKKHFKRALKDYSKRNRRFGK